MHYAEVHRFASLQPRAGARRPPAQADHSGPLREHALATGRCNVAHFLPACLYQLKRWACLDYATPLPEGRDKRGLPIFRSVTQKRFHLCRHRFYSEVIFLTVGKFIFGGDLSLKV